MTTPSTQPGAASTKPVKAPTQSRAALREIQTGSFVLCAHCGKSITWQAKDRQPQIVCNVYVRKKWDHIEHFHAACYEAAGEPYGEADTSRPKARLANKRA